MKHTANIMLFFFSVIIPMAYILNTFLKALLSLLGNSNDLTIFLLTDQ